ncbi:MAG: tripartite tricarboxylate transporter substrate binding protein [Pseudomonadota bacterium]
MQTASSILPIGALRRRPWLAGAAGLLLSGMAGSAAAEDYPTHPVRLVVGGGPDQLARIVADKLAAKWGQGVFVEQRAGASGALATEFIASQPPDGYNLLLTTISFSSQTVLQRKVPGKGRLLPVAMIATLPFVLVVNNDLPFTSVPELVAYAKAHPGTLNFGSAGIGAPGQLNGEMLKQMAGIDMVVVNYKSVAAAVTDVMSNQIQLIFSPVPAALQLVKAGKLRAIAVSSPQRYGALLDVPTVMEQGYPDFQLVSWNGIHVGPGTPVALRDRIAADIAEVMNTPDGREKAQAAGFEPNTMLRVEFEAFMRADVARIAKVIKDGNIKPE